MSDRQPAIDAAHARELLGREREPAERLEPIPWAERTAEEQERYERTQGRSF
jgi:hypothetical protein